MKGRPSVDPATIMPDIPDGKGPRCPVCGMPTQTTFKPFCSRRCADVDLARWLGGAYAIPGAADADEDGDQPPPASRTNGKSTNGAAHHEDE